MLSNASFRSLPAAVLVLAMALAPATGTRSVMAAEGTGTEFQDRAVDSAALAAQQQAIANIRGILGSAGPQTPVLLYNLAELHQQSADMRFRVAHGKAQKSGKAVDLGAYRADLRASLAPLNQLISRYPGYNEIGHAYFMRAKALDESGEKSSAARDYLHVVSRHAKGDDVMPSYLALAQISIARKNHRQAIDYLRKIEARPSVSHYPVALYHLAWSYFTLGRIQECLRSSESLLAHLKARPAGAERGMLENLMSDIPGFYFTAFERKLPAYTTASALGYFKRYAEQPELGKMAVQYAYLLRTRGYGQDLKSWKNIMLAAYPESAESHEVLLATYEYQLSRGDFDAVARSSQDIAKVASAFEGTEVSAKAEKLLVDSTKGLQRLLFENDDPARGRALLSQLAFVYDAFARVAKKGDPRLRSFHLNLAETLFSIKDYDKAAEHYRWVLEHGGYGDKSGGVNGTTASLKAISSRYEELRQAKLIPSLLKPGTIPPRDAATNPRVRQWVEWVEDHVEHAGRGQIDSFAFDAYRTLYFNGQVNEALQKLRQFATASPKAPLSIPAATLVMDTYIANAQWKKVEEASIEFLAVDAWKGTQFRQWAYKVGGDSKYKQAKKLVSGRDYGNAIEEADNLEKTFPKSPQLLNALSLAGNAAVAMKDRELAIHYYDKLARNARDGETIAQARLSIAQLEEERYNFAGAAGAYLAYLKLPSKAARGRGDEIRRRILLFAWLGGNDEQLGKLASNKSICTPGLRAECDKYRVLKHLMNDSVPAETSQLALRQARSAPARLRGVWAAMALDNADRLSSADRRRMTLTLARGWKDIDAMTRFSLIPRISESVPKVFELERAAIDRGAKLQLSPRSIQRRLRLVADLETTAVQAGKLPWLHIRSRVLGEIATAYLDLSSGLRAVPMPERLSEREKREYPRMLDQLVSPYERKSAALRSEATRLASRGSADLDLDLVRSADRRGTWGSVDTNTAEPGQVLRSRWALAIEDRDWRQVAFFVNQAQAARKASIPAEVLGVARAVSLAATGARAEAALQLSTSKGALL